MAKCPVCSQDLATPFFTNVDAWRWLTCPHCAARLERKNSRFAVAAGALLIALIALGRSSHRAAVIAEVLMVVVNVAIVMELLRPRLQVRKALPKPEITLKILR